MRILTIGGTRFIGRHIVEAALRRGHEVTIFHRGQSGAELFPDVHHRIGDRNTDLSRLDGGQWDATVDTCGFVPRHVNAVADALDARGGQYVFISSVSVYADPADANFGEDAPLAQIDDPSTETITNQNYGALKVLCEGAAHARFGPDTLVVRPTYVVGPDDYSWRFPWWVTRMAAGGEVLAPGPAGDHAQVIDVRDMAEWIVAMIERRAGGTFHAVGPSATFTWGELLENVCATVGTPGTSLTWVGEPFLLQHGVDGEQLPMWTGGDTGRLMMAADPSAGLAAGLHLRPLAETISDTLAWAERQARPPTAGLPPEREAELLAAWKSSVADPN